MIRKMQDRWEHGLIGNSYELFITIIKHTTQATNKEKQVFAAQFGKFKTSLRSSPSITALYSDRWMMVVIDIYIHK